MVRDLIEELHESADLRIEKIRLESNEVTKSTFKMIERFADLEKTFNKLDKYTHDKCENPPFIKKDEIAKTI